jgi:hypothetical protein
MLPSTGPPVSRSFFSFGKADKVAATACQNALSQQKKQLQLSKAGVVLKTLHNTDNLPLLRVSACAIEMPQSFVLRKEGRKLRFIAGEEYAPVKHNMSQRFSLPDEPSKLFRGHNGFTQSQLLDTDMA